MTQSEEKRDKFKNNIYDLQQRTFVQHTDVREGNVSYQMVILPVNVMRGIMEHSVS